MDAIIDHNPELGGAIQVSHGADCISLVISTTRTTSGVILKPEEAITLALDLIIQTRSIIRR